MNKGVILLKALLLSTSGWNIYRHSTDGKKRRRIILNTVGMVLLFAMLVGYSVALCYGYGQYGLIDAVPVTCALMVSAIAFVFTLFKTNGYLFGFKEYDMLMALPLKARTVAGCKFLYMYIKSLTWYGSISVAMLIGYGIFAHPPVLVYPAWLVLSLFLPVIPMLVAAFIGFLIARISAGFRKSNVLQTALMLVFMVFCFSLRYIIEGLFRDGKTQATLQAASNITGDAGRIYLPAGWFADAILKGSVSSGLLLVGASVLLFAVVFVLIGRSYRQINSALKSHAASRSYRMTEQKQRGQLWAIAFKEFRRLTGSTPYMVNGAIGHLLATLLGIVALIFGMDRIIAVVTSGAPIDAAMLRPALPLVAYFFIGMLATTACSPSLEGKNYWIIQSMPIEKRTVYQGKMLFNMLLAVPFMLFSTLCLCLSAKTPALETVLNLILGVALCAFSTCWGCVCGIRHMRLDWENEIEVIKQGAAVSIYLLPNMFVVMALIVGAVILGLRVDHKLISLALTAIATLLAVLSYRRVMILAKEK